MRPICEHSFGNFLVRTKMNLTVFIAALAQAILAGCVSAPAPLQTSASHPANPRAAQSPLPPPEPILMSITNMVMVTPATKPTPEAEHSHGKHETKPDRKSTRLNSSHLGISY